MGIITQQPNGKLALFSVSEDSFYGCSLSHHEICMILFDTGNSSYDIQRKFKAIDRNDFGVLLRKELYCIHHELDVESSEFKKIESNRIQEIERTEPESRLYSCINLYRYPLYVGDNKYIFVNDVKGEIEFIGTYEEAFKAYKDLWSIYFSEEYLMKLLEGCVRKDKGHSHYLWAREYMSNSVELLGIK